VAIVGVIDWKSDEGIGEDDMMARMIRLDEDIDKLTSELRLYRQS
jgi:hypothetical protein